MMGQALDTRAANVYCSVSRMVAKALVQRPAVQTHCGTVHAVLTRRFEKDR